jgi:pimeloyl-ACP methyl ester carboxylesterase
MPTLSLEDVDLYYECHGEGPAFLMISTTASDGEPWKKHQVPEFSRDHTVVIFDQRDTGKSKAKTKELTTDIIARDAVAILDHLGLDQAIVMGHSMGGRVAQNIALDHPKYCRKLILVSSGAPVSAKGLPLLPLVRLIEDGYENYIREHSIWVGYTKEFAEKNTEEVDEFISARMASIVPVETYLRYVLARQEHDTAARLKDIKVPTLVMVGEDEGHALSDTSHLAAAQRYAKEIPGATFASLPDQGHFYPYCAPDETHKIIRDFLATT